MKFTALLLLLSSVLCLSGCFGRYQMTEREIRQHYAGRAIRPTFDTIDTHGGRLFVASVGADTLPPLLLIHGAPGAWYGYLNMLDDTLLNKRFHLLSVDRPGYNQSRRRRPRVSLRTQLSVDHQAQLIAQALLLNHSGQPALVLGRSYGAPVAVRLATLYPQRIGHTFLVSPAIDPDKEKFWWFSPWGRLPFVQLFLPRQLNTATVEKYAHVAELRNLIPCWAQLQTPVTVMTGRRDWILNAGNLDFARRMLAGKRATFIDLPDAEHLITRSHAALVRSLIVQAADSMRAESSKTAGHQP